MYGRMSVNELAEVERKSAYKDFKRWQKIVAAKKGWTDSDVRLNASLIDSERANQSTVIAQTTISMHIVKVPYRVGRQDGSNSWGQNAVHFQVKIWLNQDEKRAFVFTYSQGSAVRQFPTIREILYSFIQDALFGSESFQNFCDNTGAESDSIRSQKSYEDCVEIFSWFLSNRVYESKITQIAGILQEADNRGDLNITAEMMEMPLYNEDEGE